MFASLGLDESCQLAGELIQRAHHVVVFTGAGVSTSSGIPDFRSPGTGIWSHQDPMEVASLSAFQKRPRQFYNWFSPLLVSSHNARPNSAHKALVKMENNNIVKAIITQNIDGLHQKAGSINVVELHGSMEQFICIRCHKLLFLPEIIQSIQNGEIPCCPDCGSILKPNITLFEELLPVQAWNRAVLEIQSADLVWVIGSSLSVYPAAQLPKQAILYGAKLIINTRSSTPMDDLADLLLPFEIAETVPKIATGLIGSD